MRVYKLLNQKDFTTKLFASDTFDNFLLTEFDISKEYSMYIDGRKPCKEGQVFVRWGDIRALALASIKGSEPPRSFKVVIKLSKENTESTLKALGISIPGETGLFLNIRYAEGVISCISGTSTSEFTVTKDLENGWGGYVKKFFEMKGIEYEEM